MSQRIVFSNLSYHLIQSVRFVHAIAESKYNVCIDEKYEQNFTFLKNKFNMKYDVGSEGAVKIDDLTIRHDLPSCTIGNISRTLIFPNSIVEYCKEIWDRQRKIKCSFTGLLTEKRIAILDNYIKNQQPNIKHKSLNKKSKFSKFLKCFSNNDKMQSTAAEKYYGDILIWSSAKGRAFPEKSWDEDYYRILAKSKFVLCPNGDYVWSYRFFESILCGAIPIIQDTCPAYEGFKYKTMRDDLNELTWCKEDAEYNYRLCCDRITVLGEILNSEIRGIIDQQVDGI